ncbi:hypothetical protein ACIRYZ_17365 [Kitasatospora sp. NPDC101155]|uniref:hypothetical protein n=1 Tax=Kitasatospora sp. NPDC101155 TaxID=3364097 RepID=UPI00382CCD1E
MAVPRILLAAAVLTGTALACLTGCTPADSRPTVNAASSAAALADEGADDPLDDGDDLADDEAADSPGAGTIAAPDPGYPCPAPSRLPGHQVLVIVAADPTGLTAQTGRYGCTPPHYEATGTPVRYGFAASGVTATLVDRPHGDAAKPVQLDELVTHLNDCLADLDPADPYACFGNAYDVVLDSHGGIMRIGEIEGP